MLHIGKIELNHDGEARAAEVAQLFKKLGINLTQCCGIEAFKKVNPMLIEVYETALESMASLPANQKDPATVAKMEKRK